MIVYKKVFLMTLRIILDDQRQEMVRPLRMCRLLPASTGSNRCRTSKNRSENTTLFDIKRIQRLQLFNCVPIRRNFLTVYFAPLSPSLRFFL